MISHRSEPTKYTIINMWITAMIWITKTQIIQIHANPMYGSNHTREDGLNIHSIALMTWWLVLNTHDILTLPPGMIAKRCSTNHTLIYSYRNQWDYILTVTELVCFCCFVLTWIKDIFLQQNLYRHERIRKNFISAYTLDEWWPGPFLDA